MALAGGEFIEINTENIKLVIDQMVDKLWWLCPMMEIILDHGSEFGAHRIHDDGSWNGDFKDHLEKYGIKPILARVNLLRLTGSWNGFSEIQATQICVFFFRSIWYNNPPRGSLNLERLETPKMAFRRKMPQEAYFSNGNRLFGL